MTRRIILTADEAAQVRTTVEAGDGTVWIVRDSKRQEWSSGAHEFVRHLPPAVFVAACQPCPNPTHKIDFRTHLPIARNPSELGPGMHVNTYSFVPCPDCRIELVGVCCGADDGYCFRGDCSRRDGTVTIGYAYAVGQPLPIVDATKGCDSAHIAVWRPPYPPTVHFPADHESGVAVNLAHYGPPDTLVGKWALHLEGVTR